MSKTINIATAAEHLAGVLGLKESETLKQIGATGDVESIVSNMTIEALDTESVEAGIAAAAAAASMVENTNKVIPIDTMEGNGKLIADLETSNSTVNVGLDLEYFEPSNPAILKSFSFALAANTLKGDAGLDQMFPVVNIPSNVEGALLTLPYGFVKSKFTRDDVNVSGETRMNAKSVLTGLRNPSIVNSQANLLVPVSNAKNNSVLDVDYKTENYKHPTTGELITTAPIKFGAKFDLTTIAHTAKLVSEGVFADETSLDIGGHVTNVYGTIDADKFKFDIASLPMNEIIAGGSGDAKDLVLNIGTEHFVIDPATMKQFDGSATAVINAIAPGLKLVYSLNINGAGNEATCDWGISAPIVKLIKVVNADGEEQDVTKGEAKAAYEIGVKLELTSYDLNQTVTNADLRIIANVIDVGEMGQRIGVGFGAVDSYESTLLTDNKQHMAQTLLGVATVRSNTRKRDLQLLALKANTRDGSANVNGGGTKNLTSKVLTPYEGKSTTIDLAGILDSREHSERGEDISSLLGLKIASVIPAMIFDTNYASLVNVYGRGKIGIGVTFGSDLIPFMPESISCPGVEIKMALTEVSSLKSDIYVYPMDLEHNSSVLTPLNYGVRLSKPDLVVTGKFDKISGTFVVPRNRVEVLVDIIQKFSVTNIPASLDKLCACK